MSTLKKYTLEEATGEIISKLKQQGIIIQRYDSITTKSVYLKLDYGVANSIRISDHRGKKHLAYRFNLQTNIEESYTQQRRGLDMHYYSIKDINKMLFHILMHREGKINQYGLRRYKQFMKDNQSNNKNAKGFWSKAVLV